MRRDRHCAFRHPGSDERHGHDHIAGERADVLVDSRDAGVVGGRHPTIRRSDEHTSELLSLTRIPYTAFCLKKPLYYTKSSTTLLPCTNDSTIDRIHHVQQTTE